MTSDSHLAVEQRLTHLLHHLGLAQAHWAGRTTGDWHGLVTTHPDQIGSLTLMCPSAMDALALRPLAARVLLVTGDHGPAFERASGARAELVEATHVALDAYSGLIWDDVIADHPATIGAAMLAFLQRMDDQQRTTSVRLPEGAGEHAGLFYRIQGEGPPLVLLPLGLASSQWEPLIPLLERLL